LRTYNNRVAGKHVNFHRSGLRGWNRVVELFEYKF